MLMRYLVDSRGGVPVENTIIRSVIESYIIIPLVSVDLEQLDGWCALKSPRIWVSSVVRDVLFFLIFFSFA